MDTRENASMSTVSWFPWRWAVVMVAALLSVLATSQTEHDSRTGRGGARPAQSTSRTETVAYPVLPEADYDYSRLVRVWNIGAPRTDPTTYGYATPTGSRIILTANTTVPGDLPLLASAGFTLLQTDSDHLSTEQVRPNVYDFANVDAMERMARQAGFDWCYFPHFAFPPPWYSERINYTRIRCLEHDQTVEAYSPWDPNFGYFVSRGYEILARHFLGTLATQTPGNRQGRSLPVLYVGIHGDYGECGLLIGARVGVPGQKEHWQSRFGNLHNHLGWWCADQKARESFRTTMLGRYGDLSALNAAWRTSFSAPEAITYPSSPSAGSRRYWLDFVHWYRQSVSAMTDMISRVARRHFPDSILMLPCGFGDEDPRTGADNSMLAKIAARHRMDIRSTHGGSQPFAENQASMLGRLASACRFYNVPFWTEPPSAITPEGQVARLFESITLGARGHFDWTPNVRTGRDAYYRFGKHLRIGRRVVDVAMFFPTTSHLLRPGQGYPRLLKQGCSAIRDVLDYDIVDERMILDGALDNYRVLVFWEGSVVEAPVLDRIRTWVERGGIVTAYDFGKIETVEGNTDWFRDVFGYAGRLAPAPATYRFVPAPGARPQDSYRINVGHPEAQTFLAGDWYGAETSGGVVRRWTGAQAEILMPLTMSGDLVLTVRAAFPPEGAGLRREVLFNGTQVGIIDLAGEHTYRFAVPRTLVQGRSVARVTLRSETFIPAERLPGNADPRPLGMWVTYVQLAPDTAAASLADPGPPAGWMEVTLDHQRLRTEWARRLGQGWTIYYPATKEQLRSYCEVVRYVTYHLSDLDPTKKDAVAVDNAWDGVYATLCTDRVVYYNPGPRAILRTVVLSPSALAAYPEVVRPSRFTHELTLEPNTLAVIPLSPPSQELLLQCEKFTSLRGLRAQPGRSFHPGTGDTHVLVPEGGEISTRFECPEAGRYWVFYRTVRRNTLCGAQITVNGKTCTPTTQLNMRRGGLQTICAGEVRLNKGVNSLSLRPLPGQDLRADFVVLSSDPTVAGYGFAVR